MDAFASIDATISSSRKRTPLQAQYEVCCARPRSLQSYGCSRVRQRVGIHLSLLAVCAVLSVAAASAAATPTAPSQLKRVKVFAPRGAAGPDCTRVHPLRRTVSAPLVLTGAIRALLAGPSAPERRAGYRGWFSAKTANTLRGVRIRHGVAYVDFRDFSRLIPNASSSCGSALLLAQLDTTTTQFATVKRAVYSFNGDRRTFYEWLQRPEPKGTR